MTFVGIVIALALSIVGLFPVSLVAQTTQISQSTLEAETSIPVYYPTTVPVVDATLFPEVIHTSDDGYYVAYGFQENCADAGFCNYGRVQGYRIGASEQFKNDTLQELIDERAGVLQDATRISPDPIETVALTSEIEAVVLPWFSYTNPGNTEVIFEQGDIRYIFAIEMASNADVIAMARSAFEVSQ